MLRDRCNLSVLTAQAIVVPPVYQVAISIVVSIVGDHHNDRHGLFIIRIPYGDSVSHATINFASRDLVPWGWDVCGTTGVNAQMLLA